MSEFTPILDRLAAQQIDERVRNRAALRSPSGGRRPRGRHGLAHRLHALADRLDG
jgi:hypothetical protein